MLDYNKIIRPVVQKYTDHPKDKWPQIIEEEAKKIFSDKSYEELVEIYENTDHKWLVLPELERRESTKGQLSLFCR